jgi:hypothetical protein
MSFFHEYCAGVSVDTGAIDSKQAGEAHAGAAGRDGLQRRGVK